MSFVPEDELKGKGGLNLAPMIDFLFLMLMFFASLAVSRVMTKDTDIQLVEIKPESAGPAQLINTADLKIIHITINADGEYKWVTDIRDYSMLRPEDIANELSNQYKKGLLASDKNKTQVMLKIDKQAPWEPILKAIFAIRDAGFDARPIYEPLDNID